MSRTTSNKNKENNTMLTDTIRKMASVQHISSLAPIENSDFLEVAMMKDLGWKVVVKKGEFKVGDTVIYFEIDSAINVKDLVKSLEFLKDKGTKKLFTGRTPDTSTFSEEYVRIKTIKLRGQISQGLILPVTAINDVPFEWFAGEDGSHPCLTFDGGEDMTRYFRIEVWDRLVEWFADRSQLGTRAQFHRAADYPSDVPKTDEIRVQTAYFDLIKDPVNTEGTWEVTEKNDGSSCTLFYRPLTWKDKEGGPMQIASRRFMIKDDGSSDDWFDAFKRLGWDNLRYKLDSLYGIGLVRKADEVEVFLAGHELAIQGEMIGPKFNGNRDKNKENHFRVFRIFDITEQKFVTPRVRYGICKFLGLEHVKVIETCQIFKKLKSIDEFLEYAEGKTDNGLPREGVVFKRIDDGSVSFKAVSNSYLLHEK